MIVGVDEVGRGPIVGDLLVCAVAFRSPNVHDDLIADGCLLIDSKAFKNRARREDAFRILSTHEGIVWKIARRDPKEIDEIGIHQAVLGAMAQAALEVTSVMGLDTAEYCFDGRFVPSEMAGHNAQAIIKGDASVPQISAASILAKVIRDREMCELGRRYPHYGFEKNAGYGTAQHISAIKSHGLIAEHRSWARKFLSEDV